MQVFTLPKELQRYVKGTRKGGYIHLQEEGGWNSLRDLENKAPCHVSGSDEAGGMREGFVYTVNPANQQVTGAYHGWQKGHTIILHPVPYGGECKFVEAIAPETVRDPDRERSEIDRLVSSLGGPRVSRSRIL